LGEIRPIDNLWTEDVVSTEWIIGSSLLPRGSVMTIAGDPSAGKSFLA